MERNWLIRTTQNQILGPVAKAKVLEFLQKGALGLSDEVCSGNGYWFSLKEKNLVDKYLYGDVPQGYNPISEAKSVLSKRENPNKTTSINTSPANKTQTIKPVKDGPVVLPASDDLEYPDLTMLHTKMPSMTTATEEMKLPNQDDLEFPDMGMISSSVAQTTHDSHGMQSQIHSEEARPIEMKSRPSFAANNTAPSHLSTSNEPIVYPEENDLDYPDLDALKTKLEEVPESHIEFKVEIPESTAPKPIPKNVTKEFNNEFDHGSGLSLTMDSHKEKGPVEPKFQKEPLPQNEEKKLLHERKVKSSSLQITPKEVTKDLPKELPPRSMPEHLKKRNDNYLMYLLVIIVLIILSLFFYYYSNILNKPLPV
jgi:hypothetical protein